MNELLKIDTSDAERITVSARELYEFLEATERFNSWFDRMTQYGLVENTDYTTVKKLTEVPNNGGVQIRELDDYQLTIDTAKQIAMLQRNEKGTQGGKKSMDRASGSGVFARDPDAMIDLIQIPLTDGVTEQQINKAVCDEWARVIKQYSPEYYETIPYDDFMSRKQMGGHLFHAVVQKKFINDKQAEIITQQAELKASQMTAWRVDMTLREFPKPQQTDIWFDYPIHTVDTTGVLADIPLDEELPSWQRAMKARKTPEENSNQRLNEFGIAFENLSQEHDEITVGMLADELCVEKKTIYRRIKESNGLYKKVSKKGEETTVIKNTEVGTKT